MKKAFAARGIKTDAAAGPQLRARHARPRIRRRHPRLLARLLAAATTEARERVVKFLTEVLNTEKFPLTVMDRPIESRDHQDRRELLPGHDPGVPERVEPLRRAQRRGPDQGHQGHQDAARRTATSSSPARASAATACPRTAGWATGPTSTSWASRTATTSSRSHRRPSTSTTPAACTWPS